MAKTKASKLKISRETIRVLQDRQLAVAGGAGTNIGGPCLYRPDGTQKCCPTTITH